ncbi:FHA domain-containing protein [Streptomyces sp. ACA25]|uniref:FHA domain-containing protein n=1 Tax=Streptomyces sp. ACA25 TaxID=3022596 RepID=UPI003FA7D3E2
MARILLVPGACAMTTHTLELNPGEVLTFGRTDDRPRTGGPHLVIRHAGVSRRAGIITAASTYWSLTNLSTGRTYVVENPEGAGEHIKIAPGRAEAPIPFEFSRVLLPAGEEVLSFDVWAPEHEYLVPALDSLSGELTAPAFPLDRTKRYFLVLVALCEPKLREEPFAPVPTVAEIVRRLKPVWPAATSAAVQWNIDYLAVKLRLKPPPETMAEGGPRFNGKKESLVSLALRFNLLCEDDLALLWASAGTTTATTASAATASPVSGRVAR